MTLLPNLGVAVLVMAVILSLTKFSRRYGAGS